MVSLRLNWRRRRPARIYAEKESEAREGGAMTEKPQTALTALSRPLAASDTPPEGLVVEIVANEAERAAAAELNDLPGVLSLEATLRARKWRGDGLEVDGELRARVRQICVATLEEFESDVVEPVHLRFAPAREAPRSRRRAAEDERDGSGNDHDPLGEDPPDELIDGAVDLGAVVLEFLTLALDPYPRKPGAAFAEPGTAAGEAASPFATLKTAFKKTSQN